MHICLIAHGGTSVLTMGLARHLQKKHEVSLIKLSPYLETCCDRDFRIYELYSPFHSKFAGRHATLWSLAKTSISLFRLLNGLEPDIIHGHGDVTMSYLIAICKRTLNKASMVTMTRSWSRLVRLLSLTNQKGALTHFLPLEIRRSFIIASDHIICLNKYTRNNLLRAGISGRKISVIHYGIRENLFPANVSKNKILGQRNNDSKIILFWGDGIYDRGFHIFLSSIREILEGCPNAYFVAALRSFNGNDELRRCASKIAEETSRFKILLSGKCSLPIGDIVASADIVALPYVVNPLEPPLTLLESMALSKPVITTAVGGNDEIVTDHENGVLIAPSPSQLAKEVIYLLSNEKAKQDMANHAKDVISERYCWKKCVKEITELYESLLKK